MTATRTRRRAGYTLMELIVVMAILLILGGLLAPTFSATSRDTRVKAGADVVRGRMEEARGSAIEDARPYRFSVSTDGKRVRVLPEGFEEGMVQPANDDENPPFFAEDELPRDVTVVPVTEEQMATADGDGWVRVATFLPDGTCKEDHAILEVREAGVHPMIVTLRGLTGTVSVKAGKAGANP
jgi:prepilin-type N-terminal cleavage/methylation domain-containing protein